MDCVLLYIICFGDELGLGFVGLGWCVGVFGCIWLCWDVWGSEGSEVRKPSLVHQKHSRTDRIA